MDGAVGARMWAVEREEREERRVRMRVLLILRWDYLVCISSRRGDVGLANCFDQSSIECPIELSIWHAQSNSH